MNYRKAKDGEVRCAQCKWGILMLERWCLIEVGKEKPHAVFDNETCDRAEQKEPARQLCSRCGQPTGRCEEDTLWDETTEEPLCEECWQGDQPE